MSQVERMETDRPPAVVPVDAAVVASPAPGPSTKRKQVLVTADNVEREIPQKRPRVIQDGDMKKFVLKFICNCLMEMAQKYMPEETAYYDIAFGSQVYNNFYTALTILRQSYNGKDNMLKRVETKSLLVNVSTSTGLKEVALKVPDVVDLLKGKLKNIDLTPMSPFWSAISPIAAMLSAYDLRYKELRLGQHKAPVSKTKEANTYIPINEYGLDITNCVLLEGVTYPPEKRSSMAQSVGPMTAVIMLMRNEGEFKQKWKDAVLRDFLHFPEIKQAIELMSAPGAKASEMRPMIRAMGDLALLKYGRQAQRMSPPPLVWAKTMHDYSSLFDHFDFSGRGAFALYSLMCDWQMSMNLNKGDEMSAKQIFFHCTWGTYKEDFGILDSITYVGGWKSRSEFGDMFKGKGGRTKVLFDAPIMNFWSKLSQAAQAGGMGGAMKQISSGATFSGKQSKPISDDFATQMERQGEARMAAKGVNQMTSMYCRIRVEEFEKIRLGRVQHIGTTEWYHMDGVDDFDREPAVANVAIRGNGKFFN